MPAGRRVGTRCRSKSAVAGLAALQRGGYICVHENTNAHSLRAAASAVRPLKYLISMPKTVVKTTSFRNDVFNVLIFYI